MTTINTIPTLTSDVKFGYTATDSAFSAVKANPYFKNATVLDNPANSAEALKAAGLDWTVSKEKVWSLGKRIPNAWATTRSDNKEVLGIVSDKYQVCQNTEAFDFLDSLIGGQSVEQVKYETAGSLFGGRKVYILARLPETFILGDNHIPYLCFSNSFDGKGSIRCSLTTVRVVCSNTLQWAIKNAIRQWGITHKGNIEGKLETAKQALGLANDYITNYKKEAEVLSTQKVDFDKFINILLPQKETVSVRENDNRNFVVESIKDLFENKTDLQNFRGSAYGLYQACADFYSNGKKLRNTATLAEKMQNEFISSSAFLTKAQEAVEAAVIA